MSEQELIEELQRLTGGLLWLSESDYPWQIVNWEDQPEEQGDLEDSEKAIARLTTQIKNQLLTINPDQDPTQIKEQELDDFFQRSTTVKDWYEEEELAECQRYQDLVDFFKISLSSARVYRLGKVEVKVYVVGQTPKGDILGIETISVET